MLTQPPPRRRAPLIAALVVVVVAAGFLAWSAVELMSAGSDVDRAKQDLAAANERLEDLRADDGVAISTARDQVLKAGQEAMVVMNTIDYRNIDAGMDAWERVTTGKLHDEVVKGRESSADAIANAKSVTKAELLSAAVEVVDERAGTATVIAALRVNVSVSGNEPTDKYMRLEGTLLRTEQGWKLDTIGQVPAAS